MVNTIVENKRALQLLARFSLPPNALGYCGKDSATEKFKDCIVSGKCVGIKTETSHFIVLYPYLKTISKIVKRSVFSYEVIESFWLGNNLIGQTKTGDYELLLANFNKQGVPENFVNELRKKQPNKFIPFHLFQVLHIGVGKSSGAVPFNLNSINNCMIRWGKVTKLTNEKITVNANSLKINKAKYILTKKIVAFPYNPLFIPDVKKGDVVSVHWGIVNKILTKKETNNLEYWTKETLKTLVYD